MAQYLGAASRRLSPSNYDLDSHHRTGSGPLLPPVARTLNFTRAAEEGHVARPSLTRAIRQLEGELGGDLFRRERPHAQLTELGQRMLPLLRQCYDSALGARTLASSLKSGEVAALRLALSHTIDVRL